MAASLEQAELLTDLPAPLGDALSSNRPRAVLLVFAKITQSTLQVDVFPRSESGTYLKERRRAGFHVQICQVLEGPIQISTLKASHQQLLSERERPVFL